MLSKKPAVLLSSYTSFSSLHAQHHPSASSTSCRHPHTRHYAQHASDPPPSHPPSSRRSPSETDDVIWPELLHPHHTPTPYQILALRRGEVYSKQRFYALAKLYHPDRCHPASPVAHLPAATRIERYRLLVAAHDILSDDAKRKAYDIWGTGWIGGRPTHSPGSPYSSPYTYGPQNDWRQGHSWRSGHSPVHNATWEDWERWYDREYGRKQENQREVYMSSFSFVGAIFFLVTMGSIVQGTRASALSTSVLERADKVNKEASMELMKSKRATMSGDRHERIRTFLEHREASNSGGEAYQRPLPPAENCTPETIQKRS